MHKPELIIESFNQLSYIVDEELATIIYLMLELQKPLLLEGNPGVGKTEIAYVLSTYLNAPLIRLQCYEGLDVHNAVYEWNYQKQLLSIKLFESEKLSHEEKENRIFNEDYLLQRPLLQSISNSSESPVLLIDEIDRTDEEFEAFLLELLSQFQITIPELGTIKATYKPFVVLTSNRTRDLGDALKRRCLYHWVNYPSFEKEQHIVQKHFPQLEEKVTTRLVQYVQYFRTLKLEKLPGIAETLDWAAALLTLEKHQPQRHHFEQSLGCVLKSENDIRYIKAEGFPHIEGE